MTELTAERLRELLSYDQETGVFTWRVNRRGTARAGGVAGTTQATGYRQIFIDGKGHLEHRLVFLYVLGRLPVNDVDHVNCVKDDNRFENLREATRGQNQQNRIAQHKNKKVDAPLGAHWHKSSKKWRATIKAGGKQHHLGEFKSAEDAHAAYLAAKANLHPFSTLEAAA